MIKMTQRLLQDRLWRWTNQRRARRWGREVMALVRQVAADAEAAGDGPQLLDFQMQDGETSARFGSPKGPNSVVGRFAAGFLAYYRENGGPNYAEFDICLPAEPERGLVITIRRKDGKTPAQLKAEADQALYAALTERAEAWRALADHGITLLESEPLADGIDALVEKLRAEAGHGNPS